MEEKILNAKIKKLNWLDILLMLLTAMFLTLLIAMLRPEIIAEKYWAIWLTLCLISAAKPAYSLLLKKGL